MIFDESDGSIYIRQSWLDTALRCPERARLAIVKPEWDALTSDSAAIGTATHAAIETHLNGNVDGVIDALDEALYLIEQDGIKWTKYTTWQELRANAIRCYRAWVDGIFATHIEPYGLHEGARTEVGFKVPLFDVDGRTVGITGTIDFVPNANVLWDWKTASQKFRAHEKQKYAIQGTIYALAAIKGGLDSDDHPKVDYQWPIDFVYGVAVRGDAKSTPQVLAVRRTEAHAEWAIRRIRGFVNLALKYGLDEPWPMNDDHFLCSRTWCPWWSICKGTHNIDDSLPPGWA